MATRRDDGTLRFSERAFSEAFENLKRGNLPEDEIETRIYAASGCVIRQRRNIPEEQELIISPEEVVEFLDGLDDVRIKKLKKIAEGVQGPEQEPIH